ncbi:zinc-dependent alcohol dehydrogenase [Legionella sp. CNM-1927-20]|uniref:zinc-dependent alcohol dehydrogenase n=1 Tax=Legionella sp. CNM-1927-20 TaxID=3422221 RepID=UPI00403A9C16
MKALCWHGKHDVRVDTVDDPKILHDRDAIVRITATAICGSDLHLYNGLVPTMESGDILGHEFMGEVVDVGKGNSKLKVGDRVVVPFPIACGECFFCKKNLFALCENSNPNAEIAKERMGHSPAALFGYSHMLGGFAGGQAEYARVPYADVGPIVIPDGYSDEQVLFLSDIFPTGYMAAENCNIQQGDTIAVWGCGPVGQFAIQSAWMLGAGRVIAIDCVSERLELAATWGKAETINFEEKDVYEELMTMTKGMGPDGCIDAVGTEAHAGPKFDAMIDKAKQVLRLTSDRPRCLREAIMCCRKGGTISIPGVYIGFADNIPFGAAMNKGLTFKMGQTHVQRYLPLLLAKIMDGKIDATKVISHRITLDEAPIAYEKFCEKEDGCIKVVMTPNYH